MSPDLIERIECGMTTDSDALIVSNVVAKMAAYEIALQEIAAYDTGYAAMVASRALAGEDVVCQTEERL